MFKDLEHQINKKTEESQRSAQDEIVSDTPSGVSFTYIVLNDTTRVTLNLDYTNQQIKLSTQGNVVIA